MTATEPLPSSAEPFDRQRFEHLAAVAAHEMSAPLATAAAAIELLRARVDHDPVGAQLLEVGLRNLGLARDEVRRLARCVRLPEPERVRTDLELLSQEVVRDLRLSHLAGHHAWVRSEGSVHADVDRGQIRQAMCNLLTNAARYSDPGTAVGVELLGTDHLVEVRVHDEGPGVPPDRSTRIFEWFEQGVAAARGLGVGLPLSREIARLHGGELRLESTSARGSVFLLSLPAD